MPGNKTVITEKSRCNKQSRTVKNPNVYRSSLNHIPRYTSKIPPELFSKVLIEHLPLVNYCAYKAHRKYHFTMSMDDIRSEGVLGLIDAIKKFDGSRAVFKTYASLKITWQILEYFRTERFSWKKKLEKEQSTCETIHGRLPSVEELCVALELSKQSVLSLLINTEVFGVSDVTTHEIEEAQHKLDPYEILAMKEVANDLNILSERDQKIMRLHFFDDMDVKSIGVLLGITGQAIDRVIRIALCRLRRVIETRERVYNRKVSDKEKEDIIEDLRKRKEQDIVRLRQDEITLDYRMHKDWIKNFSRYINS